MRKAASVPGVWKARLAGISKVPCLKGSQAEDQQMAYCIGRGVVVGTQPKSRGIT